MKVAAQDRAGQSRMVCGLWSSDGNKTDFTRQRPRPRPRPVIQDQNQDQDHSSQDQDQDQDRIHKTKTTDRFKSAIIHVNTTKTVTAVHKYNIFLQISSSINSRASLVVTGNK